MADFGGHRTRAEDNLQEATARTAIAKQESQRAQRVQKLIIDSFRAGNDPMHGGDRAISAREAADRGSEQAIAKLDADPGAQADLLKVLGDIYLHLGVHEHAIELLSRSLAIMQRLRRTRRTSRRRRPRSGMRCSRERRRIRLHHYTIAMDIMSKKLGKDDWHVVGAMIRKLRAADQLPAAEPAAADKQENGTQGGAAFGAGRCAQRAQGSAADSEQVSGGDLSADAGGGLVASCRRCLSSGWRRGNNLAWILYNAKGMKARRTGEKALADRHVLPPGIWILPASSCYVVGV